MLGFGVIVALVCSPWASDLRGLPLLGWFGAWTRRAAFRGLRRRRTDHVAAVPGRSRRPSCRPSRCSSGRLMPSSAPPPDGAVRAASLGCCGGSALHHHGVRGVHHFTGASGVTIVALGGLLMPSLLKQATLSASRWACWPDRPSGSCFRPRYAVRVRDDLRRGGTVAGGHEAGEMLTTSRPTASCSRHRAGLVRSDAVSLRVYVRSARRAAERFSSAELARSFAVALRS